MLALPLDCLSTSQRSWCACSTGARRRKAGSALSREVTHHLSVPTRLCSDSGDDEIEHAVDPIRVGRLFVHHDNSVDESEHVDNMDIRSDLFCGLGAQQQ